MKKYFATLRFENAVLPGLLTVMLSVTNLSADLSMKPQVKDGGYQGKKIDTIIPPAKLAQNGEATPEEVAAVAQHWLGELNLALPELAAVKAHADKQEWSAALDAYRDLFLNDLKTHPPDKTVEEYTKFDPGTADEILEGKVTLPEAQANRVMKNTIGQPGAIDWYKPTIDALVPAPAGSFVGEPNLRPPTKADRGQAEMDYATHLSAMGVFNSLPAAYHQIGDPRYLKQWIAIWEDFTLRDKAGYKLLAAAHREKMYDAIQASQFQKLFMTWRILNFLDGIELIAARLEPKDYAQINSTALARILIEIADNHVSKQMESKPGQVGVPNQMASAARESGHFINRIPGLAKAPEWDKIVQALTTNYYKAIVLPDGTAYEQALNYNVSNPELYLALKSFYAPQQPAWLAALRPQAEASTRALLSVLRNGSHPGALPRMGPDNRNMEKPLRPLADAFPEDPDFAKIMNHVYGDGTSPEPSFTSVVFPYSGYYVLRDGWNKNDSYVWFKASPLARGHSRQDNTCMTVALGRDLLIASGNAIYSADPSNPYFISSWSRNTIQVDGGSQNRTDMNDHPRGTIVSATTPMHQRFYTSGKLDFAEGTFDHGYVDPKVMVKHERQIISLRHKQVWIVTDRMLGELAPMPVDESHTYTQTWHFEETFPKDQVKFDQAAQTLLTTAPTEPNVRLRMFGQTPVTYASYYGWLKNGIYKGWWSFSSTLGDLVPKPAVQTEATWTGKGEQQLVTLIDAGKGTAFSVAKATAVKLPGIEGFDATLTDGSVVAYRAALEPTALSAGGVTTLAKNLLTLTSPDGSVDGLVLDGSGTKAGGSNITDTNAAFSISDGKLAKTTLIEYPAPAVAAVH